MYSRYIRDVSSEVSDVRNTFSGWDQCMAKTYCKWPAIVAIIVGVVFALSLVWCLLRCICCGAECCCGCLSCFSCCTGCCRDGHHRNQGYTQPAPVPQFPQYAQYQPAPAPVYGQPQPHHHQPYAAPRAQPQYAHFDTSAANKSFNEDALPAMPSWNTSRTVRQEMQDVEMGRMQAAPMLSKTADAHVQEYPYQSNAGAHGGDLGMSGAHSPYQEQYGYGQSTYHSPRMQSPVYEPSVAPPPSYHTTAPEVGAPGVARKPVAGSWRDL